MFSEQEEVFYVYLNKRNQVNKMGKLVLRSGHAKQSEGQGLSFSSHRKQVANLKQIHKCFSVKITELKELIRSHVQMSLLALLSPLPTGTATAALFLDTF